jgi:hypothetical protein
MIEISLSSNPLVNQKFLCKSLEQLFWNVKHTQRVPKIEICQLLLAKCNGSAKPLAMHGPSIGSSSCRYF